MRKVGVWIAVCLAMALLVNTAFAQDRDPARVNRMRSQFQANIESLREKVSSLQESINDITWEMAKQYAEVDRIFESLGPAAAREARAVVVAPGRGVAQIVDAAAAEARKKLAATKAAQELVIRKRAEEARLTVAPPRAGERRAAPKPEVPAAVSAPPEARRVERAPARERVAAPKSQETEITITISIKAPGGNVSVAGPQ